MPMSVRGFVLSMLMYQGHKTWDSKLASMVSDKMKSIKIRWPNTSPQKTKICKGSIAVDTRVLLAHFFCKIGNDELHQLESAISKQVALDAWIGNIMLSEDRASTCRVSKAVRLACLATQSWKRTNFV